MAALETVIYTDDEEACDTCHTSLPSTGLVGHFRHRALGYSNH